jgi:hypothetical protein
MYHHCMDLHKNALSAQIFLPCGLLCVKLPCLTIDKYGLNAGTRATCGHSGNIYFIGAMSELCPDWLKYRQENVSTYYLKK